MRTKQLYLQNQNRKMQTFKLVENRMTEVVLATLKRQGVTVTDEQARNVVRQIVTEDMPTTKKEMKKASQKYNRQARKQLGNYADELTKRFAVFNQTLKKRPKWIPQRVWRWLGGFFIDVEKLQKSFNI